MTHHPAHHPAHQSNIMAKTARAVEAVESVIHTRLIDDTDFPDVTDMTSGRAFMLACLQGDPAATAPWWVVVGIELDRLAGRAAYEPGQLPTGFKTSRRSVIDLLFARVWADEHPTSDPFGF